VSDVQVTQRTASGRAQEIRVTGSRRTVQLSGYEFRELFGFAHIRSPLFSIGPEPGGAGFVLEGHGWGHGVGMCQWGAAELARRGLSAPEILAYYYPGIELVPVRSLEGRTVEVIGGES
jgi:stage II sporulation protein D